MSEKINQWNVILLWFFSKKLRGKKNGFFESFQSYLDYQKKKGYATC